MTTQRTVAKKGNPRFKFISDTIAELKKVIWLSRREVLYLTTVVVIVTIVAGLFLGILDFSFSELINSVFIR